jgi:hypothetical protein
MRQRKHEKREKEQKTYKYMSLCKNIKVKNDFENVDNSQFIISREIVIEQPKDIHFKCKKVFEELENKVILGNFSLIRRLRNVMIININMR